MKNREHRHIRSRAQFVLSKRNQNHHCVRECARCRVLSPAVRPLAKTIPAILSELVNWQCYTLFCFFPLAWRSGGYIRNAVQHSRAADSCQERTLTCYSHPTRISFGYRCIWLGRLGRVERSWWAFCHVRRQPAPQGSAPDQLHLIFSLVQTVFS